MTISTDYGRSHYFFTDNTQEIPAQIHQYCYRNHGNVSDEDREVFFYGDIGIDIEIEWCDDVTPTRGLIITRVKVLGVCGVFDWVV